MEGVVRIWETSQHQTQQSQLFLKSTKTTFKEIRVRVPIRTETRPLQTGELTLSKEHDSIIN